jgi:hypothetical protein
MKIHADKIEGSPSHGLSTRVVRFILANVPPDWIEGLTHVRLANGQHGPEAFFSRYDGQLTIYSPRGTKRKVLFAVLSVLAAPSLNIKSTVARRPSGADKHRLEQFVHPFVERILTGLTPATKQNPEALHHGNPFYFKMTRRFSFPHPNQRPVRTTIV